MILAPNNVLFLCSAGGSAGLGHLRRCLTLAEELHRRGSSLHFIVMTGDKVPPLKDAMEAIASLSKVTSFEQAYDLIQTLPPHTCLILDSYEISTNQEASLKHHSDRLLVIDDLPDRTHHADFLLDQTFGRTRKEYDRVIPRSCSAFLGTRHALIRPAFSSVAPPIQLPVPTHQATSKPRVLVSFGGTDPANATGRILAALKDEPLHIDVVLGSTAPHLDTVRKLVGETLSLHTDLEAEAFVALMRTVDLCIGAGGGSSWERCAAGVPTLAYQIADNQRDVLARLSQAGALVFGGDIENISEANIQNQCRELIRDWQRRAELVSAGRGICDGRGVDRLLGYLSHIVLPGSERLMLRPAAPVDCATVLHWQSLPGVRDYARTPSIPTPEEHTAWFENRLQIVDFPFSIIEVDGKPAGFVRLDQASTDAISDVDFETAILVDPAFSGKGVGVGALTLASAIDGQATLLADIDPRNTASQAIFSRAGYHRQNERHWLFTPGVRG